MQPRKRLLAGLASTPLVASLVVATAQQAVAHPHRHHHAPARSSSRPLASRSAYWQRGSTVRIPLPEQTQPVREVRAMWVVRDSIETPERIARVVASAKAFGFNTLFVQVRGRGDAWYDSSLEPRAEELANQPASFDPLKTIIQQAHSAGIQVHAWVNSCYVWSAGRAPYSAEHIVNAHPNWLARDTSGAYRITGGEQCEGAFLSPSNAAVRQHLHDVFLEIAKKYDIDGIHFDYIRYPNRNYDFNPATLASFADSVRPDLSEADQERLDSTGPRSYVAAFPERWADWRREQVTSLVEWISKDVKAAKPWVCVSAAVFADWSDAYNDRGQDWHRWLRDGALDAVVPMAYGASTALVSRQICDAEQAAAESGRACYAGIGAWHISAQSTMEKIAAARAAGAQGIVLFSYGGVTADGATNNYLARVDAAEFTHPALLPQLASVETRPSTEQASSSQASDSETSQL